MLKLKEKSQVTCSGFEQMDRCKMKGNFIVCMCWVGGRVCEALMGVLGPEDSFQLSALSPLPPC